MTFFICNDKIVTYLTNGWETKCYQCFCVSVFLAFLFCLSFELPAVYGS